MDRSNNMTITEMIRGYQPYQQAIAPKLEPSLEKAIKQAGQQSKAINKAIVYHHESLPFVCGIKANGLQAYSMIYQIIPRKEYFDAITYDPAARKYHFYQHHFFKRYAERMKITRLPHREILLHYIECNPVMVVETSNNPSRKAIPLLTAFITTGIVYGSMEATNVMYFRTIIDHYSLTKKKCQETRKLRAKYKREKRKYK